ncbi:MAG: hypothetical protein AVDCRST_MAG06-340, partial [uncultured Nocardioides sp.]
MPRRRALTCLAAAVGLVAGLLGGCSSDDDERPGPGRAEQASAVDPPTPVERLGLVPGWGPTPRELERAAAAVGELGVRDLAGQVIVARWQGTGAPTAM